MKQWLSVVGLVVISSQVNADISLWNAHNPSTYLDVALEAFQAQSGIKVEKHNFLSERLREEALNLAKTNSLPDVLYVPSDFVGIHQKLNLSPIDSGWLNPALDSRVLASGYTDQQQFGIPLFQGNHLVLYYSKAFIEKPVTRWEALEAQTYREGRFLDHLMAWNYREMYWLIPFLSAFHAWPLDEQGQLTLNTVEFQSALDFYKQLSESGLVDPNCDHDCSVQRFKQGLTAYHINGDWIYRDLLDVMGAGLGVALLPTINGQAMKPMFSSYVLAFPNLRPESKKAKELEQFSQFMQSEAAQEIIFRQGKLLTSNSLVLQSLGEPASDTDKNMMRQMSQTKAMPSETAMTIAWIAMQRGFNRFLEHDYTAEQATAYMQKIAKRELNKAQKQP